MEGGVVEVTWRQWRGREGEGHADERGMSEWRMDVWKGVDGWIEGSMEGGMEGGREAYMEGGRHGGRGAWRHGRREGGMEVQL
jgi:hypothetical protein